MMDSGYWLCAVLPDGSPEALSVRGLTLDGDILFTSDREVDFPAATIVHHAGDDRFDVVEGTVELLEDRARLTRFVFACEAKYGYGVELGEPDTPIYMMRPGIEDPFGLELDPGLSGEQYLEAAA